MNQVKFDLLVERTIRAKRRQIVHLNKPWLQLVINEDIQTQNLKRHTVLQIVWLTRAISMAQCRLACYDSLNSDVLNLRHHFTRVKPFFGSLQILHYAA